MKVVVVDDHEAVREMIQTVFEFEGLEVTFAEDGVQALVAVERRTCCASGPSGTARV